MEQKQASHIVGTKTFMLVWIALLILTGLTITAAQLRMGEWSMVANIAIASTKAGLVLWFFMHLKYEKGYSNCCSLCRSSRSRSSSYSRSSISGTDE